MTELVKRLQAIESAIAAEKGRFTLFALFRPDEARTPGWDVLVSAPWATERIATIRLLGERFKAELGAAELVQIARVAVIRPDNPDLEVVHDAANVEHGLVEVRDRTFFGHRIERALFITSRRELTPQPA